ncbi:ATP/GTP-binding protein [Collimonas sp. OK412]|uniref:GTP-binding protein n=1 Tax=Collimonas sp. (strain OK412) TaxID=1801619 RepID=UPI0020C88051|nr:GTPase [Collimonas sp. OK412]
MSILRIVLLGPMGIGKTTAIRSLCGDLMVDCDVPNMDPASSAKASTTVGADFGVVELDGGEQLHIYGSPGQDRFDFMRGWLLSMAIGVIVMIDANDADAIHTAKQYLRTVFSVSETMPCMLLLARPVSIEDSNRFASELTSALGMAVPMMTADVREKSQMLDALDVFSSLLTTT